MASEIYRKVTQFISDHGEKGASGYDTANAPFMMQQSGSKQTDGFETPKVNHILEQINNKTSRDFVGLPPFLRQLYRVIGDPSVDYYFNRWTLLNLTKAYNMFEDLVYSGQKRIFDFGLAYMGMGHALVASINLENGKVLYRFDGGSNGWERQGNREFIKTFVPDDKTEYNTMAEWQARVASSNDDNFRPNEMSYPVINKF